MSEVKTLSNLNINKGLTKQQLIDSSITEDEISFVEDDSVIDVPAPTQAGKVLKSTADGAEWSDGGAGAVDSVNGKTGAVILTAEDVKATPQVEEMPDASTNLGKVIQYVGEDGEYKKGSMYISITKTVKGKIDLTWDGVGLQSATLDDEVFKSKVSEEGTYTFTKIDGNWTLNGQVVDLTQYGISVEVEQDYNITQIAGTPNFSWWVQNPQALSGFGFPNGVELETGEGYIIMVGDGRVYFYAEPVGATRRKWESYYDEEGQPTETQVVYTNNEDWRSGAGMTYTDRACREEYATVTEFIDEIFGWHRLDYQKGVTYDMSLEDALLNYQPDGIPEIYVETEPVGATVEITDTNTVYNEFFGSSLEWQRCHFELVDENVWEDPTGRILTASELANFGIIINGVGKSAFNIVSTGFSIVSGLRIKIEEVAEIQDGSLVNIEYTKDSSVNEWEAISGGSDGVSGIKWDKSVDLPAGTTEWYYPLINLGKLSNGEYEIYFSKKSEANYVLSDTILKFKFSVDSNRQDWDLVRGLTTRIFGIEGDLSTETLKTYEKYFQIMRSQQDGNFYLGTDDANLWGTYINKPGIVKDCFRISTIKNTETGEEHSGEIYGSINNNRYYEIHAYAVQVGNTVLYAAVNVPDPVQGLGNNTFSLEPGYVGMYFHWSGHIYNEAFNPNNFAEKADIRVFVHSPDRQNILSAVIHTGTNITCEIETATGVFEDIKPFLLDFNRQSEMYGNQIAFVKEGGFAESIFVYGNVNWDAVNSGRISYLYSMSEYEYIPDNIIQEIPVVSPAGGAVDSVNGKTGAVVLDAEDISADVDELPNTVQGHLQSMSDKIKDIEMVKVPNATIVGSPAINHGQVSGFSENDYLQFPFELDVRNRLLKVNFCFTTGEDVTTQQNVLDSYFGLALAIANGKGLMAVSHNGTSWAFQAVGTMDILPNTTYFARLTWNGMLYKTELSTNHVDYVSDMTAGSTQAPYKRTMFIGGSPDLFGVGSAHPFKGSINLNYANVEIDDNDIWEGMDDVGLGTRLDVNVSNISEEGKAKIKQIAGGLPDQTGNEGKFLTTNGTVASWESRPEYSEYSTDSMTLGLKYSGYMSRTIAFGKKIRLPSSPAGVIAIGEEIQSNDSNPTNVGNGSVVVGVKAGGTGVDNVILGSGYITGSNNITIGKASPDRLLTLTKKMVIRTYGTDYELLDLQTGQIPAERLSNTIGDINSILDSINGEEI